VVEHKDELGDAKTRGGVRVAVPIERNGRGMKAVTSPLMTPIMAPTRDSRPAILMNEDSAVEVVFIDVLPFGSPLAHHHDT
jgi:hypothetical protein